jgi:hypothetical protein
MDTIDYYELKTFMSDCMGIDTVYRDISLLKFYDDTFIEGEDDE